MSKYARNRKLVERGHNNAATVAARNRKAERQFRRWFNGLYCVPITNIHGDLVGHTRVSGGRGLIHNGRKK